MQHIRLSTRLGAAVVALGLAACSDGGQNPSSPGENGDVASAVAAPGSIAPWQPVAGDVYVCKSNERAGQPSTTGVFATTAPAGSSLFLLSSVSISTLADTWFADGSSSPTITCRKVFRIAEGVTGPVDVTITETPAPGSAVSRVFEYSTANNPTGPGNFTDVQDLQLNPSTAPVSATVQVSPTLGATVWFKNTTGNTPPARLQGCTPGYWRQEQHFDSWTAPYTPNTPFSAVFEDAFPGQTLGQVVQLGGGGLNALGRHAVAALLNAASNGVNYAYPMPQDVISAFNTAYPGSTYQYEQLKDEFARENERGCPLN